MRFVFIRHAHATSQVNCELVSGRSPTMGLTAEGVAQAERFADKAADYLRTAGLSAVFTSPCLRAGQTAEKLAGRLQRPTRVDARLTERSQGEYEGKRKSDVYTPDVVRAIHADQLNWKPPGAESLMEVADRAVGFIRSCVSASDADTYVAVTHMMFQWSLFYLCTKCHHAVLPRLHVDNCGIVELRVHDAERLDLLRWNHPLL